MIRATTRRAPVAANRLIMRHETPHAPAPILANKEVELWTKESTEAMFETEESQLNNKYRPEWTKEGH